MGNTTFLLDSSNNIVKELNSKIRNGTNNFSTQYVNQDSRYYKKYMKDQNEITYKLRFYSYKNYGEEILVINSVKSDALIKEVDLKTFIENIFN